ncbi:MAG: DNA polymerase III subunit delta [Patescibacteria group bacterium]|nr:DNA polymerase III subunit delta [Patescibacteria group bacterium]
MIILLHGEDTFRSRQRLKKLKEGFKQKYDPRGLNILQLDGKTLTLEDFNKAVATQGFLSKKRMLVIENLSENKNKPLLEIIRDSLSGLPAEENVVVFWEGGAKKSRGRKESTPLFGLKPSAGVVIEAYPQLKGLKVSQWVKREVAERDSKIEPKALALLISLVGEDLWRMSTEIDKLASYKHGGIITEADVSVLVRAKYDTDIFKLTDALSSQDQATALRLLDEQISSGTPIPYLLTMLIRQFRILLQVKDYLENQGNPYQVGPALKLHPFVAQKAVNQVKNFSFAKLKKTYRRLLWLDEKTKSSSYDPQIFFDLFTVEASS